MYLQNIPIIISENISKLKHGYLWLGGGHIDIKLSKLKRTFNVRIYSKIGK